MTARLDDLQRGARLDVVANLYHKTWKWNYLSSWMRKIRGKARFKEAAKTESSTDCWWFADRRYLQSKPRMVNMMEKAVWCRALMWYKYLTIGSKWLLSLHKAAITICKTKSIVQCSIINMCAALICHYHYWIQREGRRRPANREKLLAAINFKENSGSGISSIWGVQSTFRCQSSS